LYGFFSIFIYFYPGIRGIINHKLETIIREKVFKRLLKKEKIFFTEYRAGDLLTRLTDDISGFPKTAWFLCSGIFRAFNAFCILVLSFNVFVGFAFYNNCFYISK
jgi:ATP-binding cassette subfamily B protein